MCFFAVKLDSLLQMNPKNVLYKWKLNSNPHVARKSPTWKTWFKGVFEYFFPFLNSLFIF